MDRYLEAALKLHQYIVNEHWNGQALVGPDPGIRFNARIGRFVKSYLPFLPWSDNLTYLQAQGYWILNNWLMADLLDDEQYRNLAWASSEYVLAAQHPEGYWDYPNPEWKGRIATVEGCFAALGLLESYDRVQYEPFLIGVKKWYQFLIDGIGFREQDDDGLLAINYFAHNSGRGGGVPNNTTLVLWNLAKLAKVTNDDRFLITCGPMVAWLNHVQLQSGELPYAVGNIKSKDRIHFLCYQYNAFEFMDLVYYYRITGDQAIWSVLKHLASYLSTGLTEEGVACYDCLHKTPEVTYYTSAIAQALSQATLLGIGDFRSLADQAFKQILSRQKTNGGFTFYSRANYGFLSDGRSYPRYLSMILNHLLREYQTQITAGATNSYVQNR